MKKKILKENEEKLLIGEIRKTWQYIAADAYALIGGAPKLNDKIELVFDRIGMYSDKKVMKIYNKLTYQEKEAVMKRALK